MEPKVPSRLIRFRRACHLKKCCASYRNFHQKCKSYIDITHFDRGSQWSSSICNYMEYIRNIPPDSCHTPTTEIVWGHDRRGKSNLSTCCVSMWFSPSTVHCCRYVPKCSGMPLDWRYPCPPHALRHSSIPEAVMPVVRLFRLELVT